MLSTTSKCGLTPSWLRDVILTIDALGSTSCTVSVAVSVGSASSGFAILQVLKASSAPCCRGLPASRSASICLNVISSTFAFKHSTSSLDNVAIRPFGYSLSTLSVGWSWTGWGGSTVPCSSVEFCACVSSVVS